LLQNLSARLGIVRRRDLAQANRETYPRAINFCLYILAELAIAACDLAEVLGMAIGLKLLTGLPIILGVCITVLDTFLLFYLQKLGIRKMEAFIVALIAVIGLSFLIELFFAKPDLKSIALGFIPSKLNNDALYIAVGIIGATVMPHNLYLHSALVQTRKIKNNTAGIKQALKFNSIDSTIALNAAFFVNAAILILAAAVFYSSGNTSVAKIEDAHKMLAPMLGTTLAPILFAVALIAAGQSSTVTGTLAGQIVMEGYLNLRINPLLRRLITRLIAIIPPVVVILIWGENEIDSLLVFSQVVLSLQLGFAVIPLIYFVSDKSTMGEFAIKPIIKILAWLVVAILVYLNVHLVVDEAKKLFEENTAWYWKLLTGMSMLAFAWLFVSMMVYPLLEKRRKKQLAGVHGQERVLQNLSVSGLSTIAIALDFSDKDERLVAHAIRQGGKEAKYVLMHIVETASAKYFGASADDYETRNDEDQLKIYAQQLNDAGYNCSIALGYQFRVKEIIRLVKEANADMLVVGAHKHSGIKDWVYGETIDKVRHKLSIPVLIVSE
ncbi:MAG: Nramp family divalent metal transporter, partial [Chitinophagaceae bacterium]|nr:Nramp family divalent metal transporter [Chitinophagaceae bacterium]